MISLSEYTPPAEAVPRLPLPQILYHGSPADSLEELRPAVRDDRNYQDRNPRIYAAPRIDFASCFLIPHRGDDVVIGSFGIRFKPIYFVARDEDRIRSLDCGGAVYSVEPSRFTQPNGYEAGLFEWIAHAPVKPVEAVQFDSGVDAMIRYGVQVYFLSNREWQRFCILNRTDSVQEILNFLYTRVSENQLLNENSYDLLQPVRA